MKIRGLFYKEKVVTCIFLFIAIIGGIFIYIILSDPEDGEKIQGDFNEVLVASSYIAPGDFIDENNIEIQKISNSMFSDLFIDDIELIKNKVVIEGIEQGEIISYSKFEDSNKFNKNNFTFSSYIPRGRKAVTIPVSYYGDLNMITIGDKVDIISTYYCREADNLIAKTIIFEKEIVFISNNDKQDGQSNAGNTSESQLALLDFTNGNITDSNTGRLLVTFYLNQKETEELFKSYGNGVLNLSLCSSKA